MVARAPNSKQLTHNSPKTCSAGDLRRESQAIQRRAADTPNVVEREAAQCHEPGRSAYAVDWSIHVHGDALPRSDEVKVGKGMVAIICGETAKNMGQ